MNSAFVQPVSHDGRFLLGQCYKEYYKKTSQQRFIYVHDGDKESTPPRPRLRPVHFQSFFLFLLLPRETRVPNHTRRVHEPRQAARVINHGRGELLEVTLAHPLAAGGGLPRVHPDPAALHAPLRTQRPPRRDVRMFHTTTTTQSHKPPRFQNAPLSLTHHIHIVYWYTKP